MKANKVESPGSYYYYLKLAETGCDNEVAIWKFEVDATGLGALIIAIERATTEAKIARGIGLKRKRPKN